MAWPAGNRRSTTQVLLMLAALAAINVFFVGGGWVSDDFAHVQRLQQVPSTARILGDADAFDFYRPLAQWSLWAQGRLHGFTPSLFRAANVIVHIAICIMAFLVGRRLVSARAAWLAALAFVLTPKAPTVAVLWASARPELLMSLFALVAALARLRWNERGGWPIALVIAAYLLAGLFVCVGLPVFLMRRRIVANGVDSSASPVRVATFAAAWFFAFILPVFPIPREASSISISPAWASASSRDTRWISCCSVQRIRLGF